MEIPHDPYAAQLFQKHCASCHDSAAGAQSRVPQVSVLKTMTPAAIQRTLETGIEQSLKLASMIQLPRDRLPARADSGPVATAGAGGRATGSPTGGETRGAPADESRRG